MFLGDILHVWACSDCVGSAIVAAFESVGVVSLSITASFYVSESIIEMIWVSAWELTTAISDNLKRRHCEVILRSNLGQAGFMPRSSCGRGQVNMGLVLGQYRATMRLK